MNYFIINLLLEIINILFNRNIKYPLFNSYIIPIETYEKIMKK